MSRLADGDRSAFETVYAEAWPRVHRLALRALAGDPAAEDVAQRALLSVFERAGEYDRERGPALPWILGIASWTVRTHLRKEGRRREVGVPEGMRADGTPEEALIQRDLEAAALEALGRLSELDRQTLRQAMEERPAGATFRKRLQRAVGRLKTSWGRTHGQL